MKRIFILVTTKVLFSQVYARPQSALTSPTKSIEDIL